MVGSRTSYMPLVRYNNAMHRKTGHEERGESEVVVAVVVVVSRIAMAVVVVWW